jgi:Tfp pilus assembly protein PilN
VKTRLNLATHGFPRYRSANLMLLAVMIVAVGLGAWQVMEYFLDPPDVETLERTERELRGEWERLGQQVGEIEARLQQPGSTSQMSELTFLSQIMARKQFSWTLMLREIERVIPTSVQLVGLIPEISEGGEVFVQMEARGRTIGDLSEFIANLELTDAFRDVKAFEQEQAVVDGRDEVRVVMGADYIGAALTEVSASGE